MTEIRRQGARFILFSFVLLLVGGCAGTDQANDDTAGPSRGQTPSFVEMDLAAWDQDIRTVQLYPTGQEGELPIIELRGPRTLTLEFDVMGERGQPLSVYFYHADRVWRRDLTPSEYLESFQHDTIDDYSISTGTQVPYVHYEYLLPNGNIRFLISGNYIVRVTEQGDEDAVLFERPFFVTEQSAGLEFMTDRVIVGGQGYPSIQPFALLQPPSGIQGNVFDYSVCFVRNGRFDMARCSDRPSLMQQPDLQFYLEPEYSFEPEGAPYFLDLANLRSSMSIESADFTTSPYRVLLEPDYARFGGSGFGGLLTGQPVVSSVVRMSDANTRAEYVLAHFAYVPQDELPLSGDVFVSGSFNDWRFNPENRLTWVPEAGRYEGDLLIKQGQYEYRYMTRDRRVVQALRGNIPRAENQYAAMVYYDDVSLSTDRLIAVRQAISN